MSEQVQKSNFGKDFLSSIVVFLVALPLCMGIAIASGVPVAAGLITGIVGGLVVGCLAGSPLQVSGPAAGLTVIIVGVVQDLGLEMLGIVVLIAGGIQLLAGIFKLGQWFRAVSPAVIKGMLSGIGVLIFASQFHVMVDDAPKKNGVQNLITIPEAIQKGLPIPKMAAEDERQFRTDALHSIGLLHEHQVQIHELAAEEIPHRHTESNELDKEQFTTLAKDQSQVLEKLEAFSKKLDTTAIGTTLKEHKPNLKPTLHDAIAKTKTALNDLQTRNADDIRDSQLAAENAMVDVLTNLKSHDWAAKVGILTIALILLWKYCTPKKLQLIPAALIAVVGATALTAILTLPVLFVELPDNLFEEIHVPSMTLLQGAGWKGILTASLVIAIVASAETLLCATAVDQLHTGPRTNYDRELTAQGVGNLICGSLGALPMTGVIVRSAANVQAGGRTRLSAILHGLWLLIFVSSLAFVLRMIPTAALAGILVHIGWRLMNFGTIKELSKYGRGEVVIYLATVITIVTVDLLSGVILGIVLAAVKLLYTFTHLELALDVNEETARSELSIFGAATFVRLPQLAEELEKVPDNAELHINLENLTYIDHACLDLLTNWGRQHESLGGSLFIDWESLHANFREGGQTSQKKALAAHNEVNQQKQKENVV